MTNDELAAIRARAEAATQGPWEWEGIVGDTTGFHRPTLYAERDKNLHGLNLLGRMDPDWNGENNLNFIAHAR